MAGVREGIAFVIWPVPHYDSDTLVRYQLNDCVVAFPPQHNRSHQVVLECASLCACNSRVEMQEVVDYSDPTQSVSLLCNLHTLQLTFAEQNPPLEDPADLKFYTLATLKQHMKQFEGFASKHTRRVLI